MELSFWTFNQAERLLFIPNVDLASAILTCDDAVVDAQHHGLLPRIYRELKASLRFLDDLCVHVENVASLELFRALQASKDRYFRL